jgi:hypothetical protein
MENESKHSASYVLLVPFVMVGGFAIGIGVNLLTVVVARLALTRIAVTGREWPIVGGMLLATAPFVIFGVWVFASWRSLGTESLVAAAVIIAMSASIISGSLSMLVIGISGVMLLHRVAWPTASRLLYTLPRYQIVQNKKALNAAGVGLLGVAMNGSFGWQLIQKLLGGAVGDDCALVQFNRMTASHPL